MKLGLQSIILTFIASTTLYAGSVRILDLNVCDSLHGIDTKTPQTIAFFGSAIKYSSYRKYHNVIGQQCAFLFNKENSLKRIEKTVRKKLRLLDGSTRKSIVEKLKNPNTQTLFALFFEHGLDRKKLDYNCGKLLKKADTVTTKYASHGQSKILIHMLLPIYFDDCEEYLRKGEIDETLLISFLRETAFFHKKMYESLEVPEGLTVYLLIPKIGHFMEFIKKSKGLFDPRSQAIEVIATIMYDDLLRQLQSSSFSILINYDEDQNNLIARALCDRGVPLKSLAFSSLDLRNGLKMKPGFIAYKIGSKITTYDIKKHLFVNSALLSQLEKSVQPLPSF